jgi:3'(2'), 5'-bisphosphate nucleotidase
MNEETEQFDNQFKSPQLVSMGSSLKLMLVAEGKANIYPRLGPTMEWDTAAGQAVVLAAGGQVVRADNSKPLYYNKEDLMNPYFMAAADISAVQKF